MSEDYVCNIISIIPTSVALAAVCVKGADTTRPVSDAADEATLERVHGFGLVEESYQDDEFFNVIPLTNAPDGTLVQATALDGYIGTIEITGHLVLPETLKWRSYDDVGIKTLLSSDPEEIAVGRAILQIQALVERHNAHLEQPEPAKVVRLANKESEQATSPTEPAPAFAPCEGDEQDDGPGFPTRVAMGLVEADQASLIGDDTKDPK